ncbi:lantibiotic dehydratase [Stackebrandtia nassauensis]|nr:lantibiotic dehydratase [Stackebrandtia nassauensis]
MDNSKRGGAAGTGPFRLADPRFGLARLALLPDNDPGPATPTDPVVVEGMFLSSEVDADTAPDHADRRLATQRAFDIRARRRTTPQSVFAAVADVEFTDASPDLAIGTAHRVRTYPNPVWLHQVCDQVLDSTEVLRGLRFTANNLTARRGDRLEADLPSNDSLTKPQHASIRATEAVDVIMDACRASATWSRIATAIRHRWPHVPESVIDTALRQLVRSGIVVTDLTPPDACTDPISHVLDKLPDTEPLAKTLTRLRETLATADAHPPGDAARMTALKTAHRITDRLNKTWRPLCADTAAEARIRLPKEAADQIAQAAGVLWRIAPHTDPLSTWHERFLHRYGAGRLVPVLEACDLVTGLGHDPNEPAAPHYRASTDALARLLNDALTCGALEVQLDASVIDALDQRRPGDQAEPSAEIYTRIVVASSTASDGDFCFAVTNTASPAGSTRARFTGLVPDGPVVTDTGQDTMVTELAFRPLSFAVAALTGRAEPAPWRIPIGTVPRPGDLLPDDLAVISNGQRLGLWSIRHHRPVKAVHHNQLGHHLMPPLAGFLCRLSQHGTVAVRPWTWGPFESAAFTPRVRFGNVILAPARWRLPEDLRQAAKGRTPWDAALKRWRTSTRPALPITVVVEDTDRHLPLDLDRDDDRELFRRYVSRGVAAVTEPPGGPQAIQAVVPGAAGRHALEIVVPLAAIAQPEPVTPLYSASVRCPCDGAFLPGGPWLSLAIDAPPSTQDAVLARITHAATDVADLWKRWFWLRYDTPQRGPHLRIRFHGDPATLGGQLLPILGQTCAALTTEGLSSGFGIETYHQETERYGGPGAIELVEDVFHHDAHLTARLLSSHPSANDRLAVAAVSAAEIARIVADGDRAALTPYRLDRAARHVQGRLRPRARAFDDTTPLHPPLWEDRAAALKIYRAFLPPQRRVNCASSLIHMHANRLLGDNNRERIARALAADLIARTTP